MSTIHPKSRRSQRRCRSAPDTPTPLHLEDEPGRARQEQRRRGQRSPSRILEHPSIEREWAEHCGKKDEIAQQQMYSVMLRGGRGLAPRIARRNRERHVGETISARMLGPSQPPASTRMPRWYTASAKATIIKP